VPEKESPRSFGGLIEKLDLNLVFEVGLRYRILGKALCLSPISCFKWVIVHCALMYVIRNICEKES